MVNLPGNLAPGTWYIGALADYHSQIGESNEANNNGNYLTITVPAQNLAENDAASNDTLIATCWSGTQLVQAMASSFAGSAGSLTGPEPYASTMAEGPVLAEAARQT